jgi:uncharacterized protein YgiM (DUF1202 family)
MKRLILLAAALIMASSSAMADNGYLYILSARAKLLSEPSFSSQSLDQISKGQKVETISKTNNWFKVKYRNQVGWLSRLSVSPHPPMKRVSLLAKGDKSIVNQSRLRSSAVSTTAAVRGLRSDGRSRVSSKSATDYQTLAKIEAFHVDKRELDQFIAGLD